MLKQERTAEGVAALVLTAGVALILAVAPGHSSFSSFITTQEMTALKQRFLPNIWLVVANLTEMREAIIASDAWRSFFIIVIGCLFLFLYQLRS